jgi:RNA-directed DNA polymerase
MVMLAGAAQSTEPAGDSMVNGPDGAGFDWDAVDWRSVEDDVRRLRQRIFTATQAGNWTKVRNLQKLILRSRSNALVSVRRVTEINAGRRTTGVDGRVVLLPGAKAEMVSWLRQGARSWSAMPVRRVFIPKANGKQRPLGIPVVADRALQALVTNALEPEWEARFEPKSYGFRPGRGCQDAIQAIYLVGKGPNPSRRWVLDADLAAAFDRIDHSQLLRQLGSFPGKSRIEQWLVAGVVDREAFVPTVEGTPQGGLCSAEHNPPYEQCWVMCSADLSVLVRHRSVVERCA